MRNFLSPDEKLIILAAYDDLLILNNAFNEYIDHNRYKLSTLLYFLVPVMIVVKDNYRTITPFLSIYLFCRSLFGS